MSIITWLHLSDLHFEMSDTYNMDVVLEAFLRDLPQLLSEDKLQPEFLAITGDIAFSGQTKEYELASHFLDNLRANLNELPKERLFMVPGNHDVNRKAITAASSAIIAGLNSSDEVNNILSEEEGLTILLKKFDNYATFLEAYSEGHLCLNEKEYFFVRTLEIANKQIAITGLNSAWASTSDEDENVKLIIGERQIREALKQADKADIRFTMAHHPFELLKDFDRKVSEALLARNTHFILSGHRHDTRLFRQLEPDAEVMVLSAGACYQKRREFNSCNCVSIDLEADKGTVYLYAYTDKRGGHWVKDTFTYPDQRNGEWTFDLPGRLTNKRKTTRRSRLRDRPILDSRFLGTIRLYLNTSFKRDQFVELDQAGETDPERSILIKRVFTDLEVEHLRNLHTREHVARQVTFFHEAIRPVGTEEVFATLDKPVSAMDFFMREQWLKIALIGGPGSGKSTLGQYLAQVHRADLLGRTNELYNGLSSNNKTAKIEAIEFKPQTSRIPFRVVLKYFAQWLTEGPNLDSLEAYLAEQVYKVTSRSVSAEDIQYILCHNSCLIILDGLDEVQEPKLRNRMLTRLSEFLGRADQLDANLQILATSRPTGYNDQFDPSRFLHLSLLPLSPERAIFYARRWIEAKVPLQEERERVLGTLVECQKDEQVKLLLATPLQVTIVLLIIKDGGRPPRQREALFDDYWGTIFRREKAKAKWIIQSEEMLLFDLHAYLAYLLHHRAASEDTISLLPEMEFNKSVQNFLRQKDTVSPDELIEQRAMQLVSEARDRLVLLVEPQSGFFGFELRSLQEFFTAAYLAQTARDTTQRFQRFKAIARIDHWYNVALFFAGRIVRTFTGEAANILEVACRPVDRELPDRYLRRGAWLALDIAADGAFANNRDLHYSALEYGLSVLESGLTTRQGDHLQTALRQIPPEDQRDILRPVLKKQLRALSPSYLEMALYACGEFIRSDSILQDGLEICLAAKKPVDILAILDLAVQCEVDPGWLAIQLQRYWNVWSGDEGAQRLQKWWFQSPEYIQTILLIWSPSDKQIHELLDGILADIWFMRGNEELIFSPKFLLSELSSPLDQAIATLECNSILRHWQYDHSGEKIHLVDGGGITLRYSSNSKGHLQQSLQKFAIAKQTNTLLARADLLPHLRALLWMLHWSLNAPTPETAVAFLKDVENTTKSISLEQGFWRVWPFRQWPLLTIAIERQESEDHQEIERLLPFLNEETQLDISEQVQIAIRTFVCEASKEQKIVLWESLWVRQKINLPQLASLAENLGITIEELVLSHISLWGRSPALPQRALATIEDHLSNPEKLSRSLWLIIAFSDIDTEILVLHHISFFHKSA